MMDEGRVLAVRERAAAQGESLGLDRAYVTRLYTVIIDHVCELEVAVLGEEGGLVTPVAPAGEAAVFQRVSRRLDHAAIAVHDLEAAVAYFRDRIGFVEVERRNTQGERTGMLSAVMRAGDVQFVLCQGTSDESNVSRYIEHYGSGVQHVAIEVSDVAALVADLNARGCDMITGVISGPGLDQSFTLREPNSGLARADMLAPNSRRAAPHPYRTGPARGRHGHHNVVRPLAATRHRPDHRVGFEPGSGDSARVRRPSLSPSATIEEETMTLSNCDVQQVVRQNVKDLPAQYDEHLSLLDLGATSLDLIKVLLGLEDRLGHALCGEDAEKVVSIPLRDVAPLLSPEAGRSE